MVFRKPYAFLIKHFKIIHLILGLLVIYLTFKTTGILSFFNDYGTSAINFNENDLASKYINFFMYGAILIVLILNIIVYLLMKSKEKQTKLYSGAIIYYLIIFILLSVVYGTIRNLQINIVDTQVIRVYRDLSLIFYMPQFFFVFYYLFRGIGFDIKKFNFAKDINELNISEEDSEEIELVVNTETYKLFRGIRRFFREFKYYYLENKFIMSALIALIIIILGTTIYFNRGVYNKSYNINKTFTYQGVKLTAINSILTNLGHNGKELNNKYYLVTTINVNTNITKELAKKDFRLMIGNQIIYPIYSYNEYFIDLGYPYAGEKIKYGTNKDYLLIYEIDESQISNKYRIRIVDKINYKIGEIVPSYKDIILKPVLENTITNKGNYNLNDNINFKVTTIKDSTLNISKYIIQDNYRYEYDFCYEEKCTKSYATISRENTATVSKTLLILEQSLDLKDSYYKNNIRNNNIFFSHFISVKYKIGDKIKISPVTNKTPSSFTNKTILEVNNEIKLATDIDLIVTIRTNEYIIKLK